MQDPTPPLSEHLVVLFAKEPRPGLSKTRLAAEVGVERAHALSEAFVLDTLELARASGARVMVAHAPADAAPWFRARAPWAELWPQPDRPFDVRLVEAVRHALSIGARRVVMIGMDAPHLAPGRLRAALESLDEVEVCLGPARDGGYYLVAIDADRPEVFRDIPWSTPEVLDVTLRRCEDASLRVRLLPEEFDVDEAADLERLRERLRADPTAARRTAAALGVGEVE